VRLRPPSRTIITGALALAVGLGGCGSTTSSTSSKASSQSAQTSPSKAAATNLQVPIHPQLHTTTGGNLKTTIRVSSSGLPANLLMPARYTCIAGNTPLPISWSNLPARTTKLAVFVITAGVLQGGLGLLNMDWGAVNLDPSLGGIAVGKSAPGAVVGLNAEGTKRLSICPAKGSDTTYAVLVYALPHALSVKAGFSDAALREQASDLALTAGVLVTHYSRPSKAK
jgi:phosphatidylethanolamine-binding protein (PEBP) family uncharacterized protein